MEVSLSLYEQHLELPLPVDPPRRFVGSHVEILEGDKAGQFRKATSSELEKAKELFLDIQQRETLLKETILQLNKLYRKCSHTVFRDTEGYIYHDRHCASCGINLGTI